MLILFFYTYPKSKFKTFHFFKVFSNFEKLVLCQGTQKPVFSVQITDLT